METTNPDLIDAIYDTTLDVDKYDKLLDLWEVEFLEASSNSRSSDEISEHSTNLSHAVESHFFRAFAILDQIDQPKNQTPTVRQLIEADPLPAFLLSKFHKVIFANKAAEANLKIEAEKRLEKLPFDTDALAKVKQLVDELEAQDTGKILSVLYAAIEDEKPILFAVTKQVNEDLGEGFLQFTVVQPQWNLKVAQTIQSAFELTDTELELAKQLVRGDSLTAIAEEKNRSINTVRTQSKALLRKTKAHSQGELIGVFSAIQGLEKGDNELPLSSDLMNQKSNLANYLIRENDRVFYYETCGAPNGRPVLFMHGAITGTKLTKACQDLLKEKNIKLIAPHRAAFGKSEVSQINNKKQVFYDDIKALLSAEKIEKFSIIGHHGGSYYAYLLGHQFETRIDKITIINGAVPYKSRAQVKAMKARQRVITFTARYAPSLLPFLLRGAKANFDKDGGEAMLASLFEDSEFDKELLQNAETFEIMRDGVASCFNQGVESFKNDAAFICEGNWEDLIIDCKIPMDVFHADKEPAVPVNQVLDQFSLVDEVEVVILEGGQMILHKFPEKLLENV